MSGGFPLRIRSSMGCTMSRQEFNVVLWLSLLHYGTVLQPLATCCINMHHYSAAWCWGACINEVDLVFATHYTLQFNGDTCIQEQYSLSTHVVSVLARQPPYCMFALLHCRHPANHAHVIYELIPATYTQLPANYLSQLAAQRRLQVSHLFGRVHCLSSHSCENG